VPSQPTPAPPAPSPAPRTGVAPLPDDRGTRPLLRIQEVAAETGLTPRSIRYYEELGLLQPAARSAGSYRLYDESDLERLRFIRELRDDAGFSLAEIGRLLEDEAARIRDRERFRATGDPAEKAAIVRDLLGRVDRQVASLEHKASRLQEMIQAAEARCAHLRAHLVELEGGGTAHEPATATPAGALAVHRAPPGRTGP
jgi:DNA-binding transcriptional MerR regulator